MKFARMYVASARGSCSYDDISRHDKYNQYSNRTNNIHALFLILQIDGLCSCVWGPCEKFRTKIKYWL